MFYENFENNSIVFIWVLGHMGMPSNEKVDKEAKEAAKSPRISSKFLPSSKDLFLVIRQRIKTLWKTHWQSFARESNKLALLKDTPDPRTSSNQPSRKHETILTCLCIGRTRITHTHLIPQLHPLNCPHCDNDHPLTVNHMFICPQLSSLRSIHQVPICHLTALSNDFPNFPATLTYLHQANFLSRI